jgi:ABC-type dipeptide/oligopeptide/nickel transport system permease component
MGLRSYIVTRILLMIPMLIFLMTIVFFIVRILPGDPVLNHFEKNASPATIAAMKHALGLDVPIWAQYITYVIGIFTGNLGKSMSDYAPVAMQIYSAFPATLELAIYAIIIAVVIGVLLGVTSSKQYNTVTDNAIRVSGIVTYAIPVFFLGSIFQLVFGVWLHVLPTSGRIDPGQSPNGLIINYDPSGGGFIPILLLAFVAGLVPMSICVLIFKWRHETVHKRDWEISLVVYLFVSFIWIVLAVNSISTGVFRLQTGLYTVDSLLEGSIWKFVESFKYLLLPSLTLGIVLSGVFLRLTRTNMLETLRLDFVTSARARGLKERTVIYGYALRNAFLPVLTMVGLQFAALLGGAILTETTFSWPGLGRYLVQRINARDYTAIEGAVVFFGLAVMLVSLIVDLLYAYLDPRIRL